MRHTLVAFIAVLTLAAAPAFAGVADSPLPVLEAGKTTLHLYSVPGVRNFTLATYFSCTSMDTATMQVGIEVFSSGGIQLNDPVATSLSVPPGHTMTFGTRTAVSVSLAVSSDLGVGSPLGTGGSARILATSKKLACTAFLADPFNDPPTSLVHLTIIAKTKQKAAN